MATPTYVVQRIGDRYVPVLRIPGCEWARAGWIGGGTLLGYAGLRRGGWLGLAALAAGAALIGRALLGRSPLPLALQWLSRNGPSGDPSQSPSYQNDFIGRAPQLPADVVDEESMESFPASDPPSRSAVSSLPH